jgi:nitroreductase
MPFRAIARFGRSRSVTAPSAIIQESKPVYDSLLDGMRKRANVTAYTAVGVSNYVIGKVLEAARWAHSEENSQPWDFVVVRDPAMKENIVVAAGDLRWMLTAPVFIVACQNIRSSRAVFGERGEKLFGVQAVAAACQNVTMAAEALGLGTAWVGNFSEPKLSVLLQLPPHIRPAAIITIGWPAAKSTTKPRHPLQDIVHIESYFETPRHREIMQSEKQPLF